MHYYANISHIQPLNRRPRKGLLTAGLQFRLGALESIVTSETDSLSASDCAALSKIFSPLASAKPLSIILLSNVVGPVCRLIELGLAVSVT